VWAPRCRSTVDRLELEVASSLPERQRYRQVRDKRLGGAVDVVFRGFGGDRDTPSTTFGRYDDATAAGHEHRAAATRSRDRGPILR